MGKSLEELRNQLSGIDTRSSFLGLPDVLEAKYALSPVTDGGVVNLYNIREIHQALRHFRHVKVTRSDGRVRKVSYDFIQDVVLYPPFILLKMKVNDLSFRVGMRYKQNGVAWRFSFCGMSVLIESGKKNV